MKRLNVARENKLAHYAVVNTGRRYMPLTVSGALAVAVGSLWLVCGVGLVAMGAFEFASGTESYARMQAQAHFENGMNMLPWAVGWFCAGFSVFAIRDVALFIKFREEP